MNVNEDAIGKSDARRRSGRREGGREVQRDGKEERNG